MWYSAVLGLYVVAFVIGSDAQDSVDFNNNCGNCTVSNGLGFNSFQGDCTCYWVCTLKKLHKAMSSPANDWVSYKRCCPCDMAWSQKLLTCVSFRNKLSDCSRGSPNQNLCNGVAPGTILPRSDPDSVEGDSLCSGYVVCVQVGNSTIPQAQCCPEGQCFDNGGTAAMPCRSGACTGSCRDVDDCDCEVTTAKKQECFFQAMEDDETKFMRVDHMEIYSCAPGTCWDQEKCTCVRASNAGFSDCIPWLQMDFYNGTIQSVSGRNHFMWSEFSGATLEPNGALGTSFFARFDGDDDYINLAALANAYFGNSLILRFFFKLENNGGAPEEDQLQTIVTNCFDQSGNGFEEPTIDVCLFRQEGTGTGTQLSTQVKFNKSWFMIGNSMRTAVINLFITLSVDVWYEYWMVFLGDHGLLYNAVLNETGTVLAAKTYPVEGSKFIVVSKSGFVFGTALQSFKRDYNGGIDEILLYRCKPIGDQDFDRDFDAIEDFVGIS